MNYRWILKICALSWLSTLIIWAILFYIFKINIFHYSHLVSFFGALFFGHLLRDTLNGKQPVQEDEALMWLTANELDLREKTDFEFLVSNNRDAYSRFAKEKNYHPMSNFYAKDKYEDFKLYLAIKEKRFIESNPIEGSK